MITASSEHKKSVPWWKACSFAFILSFFLFLFQGRFRTLSPSPCWVARWVLALLSALLGDLVIFLTGVIWGLSSLVIFNNRKKRLSFPFHPLWHPFTVKYNFLHEWGMSDEHNNSCGAVHHSWHFSWTCKPRLHFFILLCPANFSSFFAEVLAGNTHRLSFHTYCCISCYFSGSAVNGFCFQCFCSVGGNCGWLQL